MAEDSAAPQPAPLSSDMAEALGAAAEGLALLVRLLDREADAELIAGLRRIDAPGFFSALMPVGQGQDAADGLATALGLLPDPVDQETLDRMAADFADCFLTHGYRISPSASVWMTIESLERQQPMFDVRDWYAHYGISVPDWRKRADDHLVHLLQFVQTLAEMTDPVAAMDAAHFMDRHVLPWVPEYGRIMAVRCATPFMQAVGALLATYPDALRDLLEAVTGIARDIAPLPQEAKQDPDEAVYIPGAAPSW